MTKSLDNTAFDLELLRILIASKGKSFSKLEEELQFLRVKTESIQDARFKKEIQYQIDCRLFMFASETSQDPSVVHNLYNRILWQDCTDLNLEIAMAIEYAAYCSEQDDPGPAIKALNRVKKSVISGNAIDSVQKQSNIDAIERMKRSVE